MKVCIYTVGDTPFYPNVDDFVSDYEEAHYHFCLMEFEKLLVKHGLHKLLKDMSEDSAFELLCQADELNNERQES